KLCARLGIGEDPTGVVVDVRRDEAGADHGQKHHETIAPALANELHWGGRQSRCLSIVITSSAVMMPARRPCSSTTASVIRLYLSKSAATSSCGVSGAQDTEGSLRSASRSPGSDVAIRTSDTEPVSVW